MLTPAKIKSHTFEASGRNAYKAESVDSFFAEVAESYEQMFRENGEMYKKIGLLAERLEEYRKDEDNIRNALLTAQRMADKITREAQEKADALLAEADERAKTENDRLDAVSNDMLQKASYQAQAIVNDAQREAENIINKATADSKEAAISARDGMIKEEAALQMMKVEVTKFKNQILDAYNEQLKLIEELPEIVYAKIEEEKAAEVEAEVVEETAEEIPEEPVIEEETVEEVVEEAEVIEEVVEEEKSETPDVYFTKADKAKDMDVSKLQAMIAEAEETNAEEEYSYEPAAEDEIDSEYEEVSESSSDDYILPDIEAIDEEIERLSKEIAEAEKEDEPEAAQMEASDIPFSKKSGKKKENGFKVNFENVAVYGDDDDDDEFDDDDDDDDDNDSGKRQSKFRGFFRK